MQTSKLMMACPVCASHDVHYTCTPNCCFNHVCADCGTTFEPVTRTNGQSLPQALAPDPLPEAADPTVACAKCDATAVYQAGEVLVCCRCHAVLVLEFTEIAPG